MNEEVLTILEEITGTDEVKNNLDIDIFAENLLDSLGTIQLLVELEDHFQISIPVSEFDRKQWSTPRKIIQQLKDSQG